MSDGLTTLENLGCSQSPREKVTWLDSNSQPP